MLRDEGSSRTWTPGDHVVSKIVSHSGEEFQKYKVYPRVHQEGQFFYMEALKGERYSIQVTNRSNKRIGIVIAVEGRNIIDGKRSDLERKEPMYIIGPGLMIMNLPRSQKISRGDADSPVERAGRLWGGPSEVVEME